MELSSLNTVLQTLILKFPIIFSFRPAKCINLILWKLFVQFSVEIHFHIISLVVLRNFFRLIVNNASKRETKSMMKEWIVAPLFLLTTEMFCSGISSGGNRCFVSHENFNAVYYLELICSKSFQFRVILNVVNDYYSYVSPVLAISYPRSHIEFTL